MVQALKRLMAFYRGVYYATLSSNLSITTEMPQHYSLNGGASNRNLTFYSPSEDYKGAVYEFYNRGATNNLVVKDAAASTIVTLLPEQSAKVMYDPTNGWVVMSKAGAGAGGSDFGAPGLLADVIGESTSAAGVTVDGLLVKDGDVRVADSDAVTFGDDQDILYTHDGTASVRVTNAAAGTVGYDDDVLNICDPADPTKRTRIDAGEVTAGQTRVVTVPDQSIGSDQFIQKATGTISAAALRTLNATPVEMVAAPAAGKYIKPLWVHWFLDYGGVQMDAAAAGDTLVARYTNASGAIVTDAVAGDVIGGATADYHTTVLSVPEVVPVAAAAIVAHITSGEWYAAAGTSELKFVIYYQVITLPT